MTRPCDVPGCKESATMFYRCPAHQGITSRAVKNMRRNAARRDRDQAMRDLGLVKVRGALGGTYWE